MTETRGVDVALLNAASRLESLARDAESVDASVPILCGMAANRLFALLGITASELPSVVDQPDEIARLLGRIAFDLAGPYRDPGVHEVLAMVAAARRHLEKL